MTLFPFIKFPCYVTSIKATPINLGLKKKLCEEFSLVQPLIDCIPKIGAIIFKRDDISVSSSSALAAVSDFSMRTRRTLGSEERETRQVEEGEDETTRKTAALNQVVSSLDFVSNCKRREIRCLLDFC